MGTATTPPDDFRLVVRDRTSDSYELSQVLLALTGQTAQGLVFLAVFAASGIGLLRIVRRLWAGTA